ncbi:MAG: P-loop NTPase [Sphingomonadales bacterium]|nr:P-loop NTPase [Sphingomonadales bacterium]
MNGATQRQLEQKLITVASGKGGVGKTWFAITLAHMLSRMGRRVLLFDGDLGLANVDIQLGLMPEKDVGDVLAGAMKLKSAVTRFNDGGFGTGGFDLLAGRSGCGSLANLSAERLAALKDGLIGMAAGYDHVVIDLAAGVDPGVVGLTEHAGTTFVLATPDPTSLTDAYALIKIKAMRNPATDTQIVINMASSKRQGEKTYEALNKAAEDFLKFSPPLAGIVKQDSRVADAIRHQAPILARHPQADAASAVAKISRRIPVALKAMAG